MSMVNILGRVSPVNSGLGDLGEFLELFIGFGTLTQPKKKNLAQSFAVGKPRRSLLI